jgi:hypothetical protein
VCGLMDLNGCRRQPAQQRRLRRRLGCRACWRRSSAFWTTLHTVGGPLPAAVWEAVNPEPAAHVPRAATRQHKAESESWWQAQKAAQAQKALARKGAACPWPLPAGGRCGHAGAHARW